MSGEALFEEAMVAFRRNDAPEALRLARAACEREPGDVGSRQLAGTAALVLGDIESAMPYFTQAVQLAKAPAQAAFAWTGLGRCHLTLERPEAAETAFRRALTLAPSFAPALSGLAYALVSLGRNSEAEDCARRAIALGDAKADVRNTLARALIAQEKLAEAESVLREALAIEPDSPDARFLLGNLQKVRGSMPDAERIYRTVLEREPGFPGWGQLVQMKTFRERDVDVERMETQLAASDGQSDSARIELLFALAKVYDDLGEPDRAVACLTEANALQGAAFGYDPRRDEERMERIGRLFTREFIDRYPDGGQTEIRAIFIASLPRSGSTLMEQMLASHPQVRGGGELDHFAKVATQLSFKWGADPSFPDLDPIMAAADLREAGRRYAELTTPLRLVQPRFTDKSLTNFQYVGLIRMMLPDARVVHIRRHPLATAFGLYRQRFSRGLAYSYDFEHIARYYRAYASLMDHWRRTCPEAFVEVFYEALVSAPERELKRILEYLQLDFDPAMLEFYRTERPVRTASMVQVREPLSTRGLDRHEAYAEHLAPLAELLADEIKDYGTALEAARSGNVADCR